MSVRTIHRIYGAHSNELTIPKCLFIFSVFCLSRSPPLHSAKHTIGNWIYFMLFNQRELMFIFVFDYYYCLSNKTTWSTNSSCCSCCFFFCGFSFVLLFIFILAAVWRSDYIHFSFAHAGVCVSEFGIVHSTHSVAHDYRAIEWIPD